MFFKDLKPNYPVFIFNSEDLTVSQGKVTSVSFPHAEMNMPGQNQIGSLMPGQTRMVVDVSIEVNGKSATYSIPENSSVTYAGNLILSTDKTGLISDIEAKKNTAEQILASVDRQKEIVEKTTSLLSELNPTFREKQETNERFEKLEESLSRLGGMVEKIYNELKS